ncbi:flagellar protein [Bradyrhizobium sp. KBS0727]|uniref:flagellar protein n=1 Tax=unclassified Bradyrhizobium TaxID=2631580 RepID=UPI00110EC4FF|nr:MULTISPECIES: flagellar protein [unclassified Bradyrhizobium]QDW39687.1 flagellar protein [Bradyrhizobium sp. KBS0725]QDW46290.1 flagellar protein [Bradyrhizobium sp. KBS0727]
MAINSLSYAGSLILNQSVQTLKNQMTVLQSQLTTGNKSTTYAGMGVNEGFAIAARSQLSGMSAFTDTMTVINSSIGVANTVLQAMNDIGKTIQNSANGSSQALNTAGQSIAQETATSQLSSMLGILNTQAGDRFLFSGTAVTTPSVASMDDILNGTTTQAGLKQVIAERKQADVGTTGLGRLVITSPTATSVKVAEDVAGSPFGLKLSSVSSSLTGATVTGPSGSPAGISIDLGATNPNVGDKVSFTFNLPDGSTESIALTASSATPPPAGSFAIGVSTTATAANLNAALNTAIGTLANTSLVAASAVQAGNDFFNTTGTATGSVVNNQAATPAPITGATLLSGAAGTDSLGASFAAGDTITVNGTPITFVASGAAGNQLNVTDNVQSLLTKIDSITGTSTPSTVSGGVISLHIDNAASLSVSSSNTAAFAALGFGATATATVPPLRVGGSPLGSATSLVSGTPANTVSWYTGNPGPTATARASATARVDASVKVEYGIQADEPAIRSQLQALAVFSAVTTSPTNPNAAAQVSALSQRITQALTAQPGKQTIQDIQTDLAMAQATMSDATARQKQAKVMLQNVVDQTETISPDQVASQLLALQTSLQASYQTTSMLSQLTLTKFLPVG